jgi:hypothetical protein
MIGGRISLISSSSIDGLFTIRSSLCHEYPYSSVEYTWPAPSETSLPYRIKGKPKGKKETSEI